MFILDSVQCADTFPTDGQSGGAQIIAVGGSSGGYFAVVGADVYVQLAYGQLGSIEWTEPFHVAGGGAGTNGILAAGTRGVRFRNYVSGNIATVSAGLSEPSEPPVQLTAPGVTAGAGSGGVTGDVVWSAASSRSNALLCNGQAVSRTTFAALFAAIGTTYGAGDGSTTFNVPDLQGRGMVAVGPHADVASLGLSDGGAAANRRPKHKHTVGNPAIGRTADVLLNDPTHTHVEQSSSSPSGGIGIQGANPGSGTQGSSPSTLAASTGITVSQQPTFSATGGTVGPQTGAELTDSDGYLVLNAFILT